MSQEGEDPLWVAIVGAGPAGYYTAEALAKQSDNVRVDMIDRLPTPFGLIRGGVAPDHQSIKKVAARYERTASMDNVRFVGNVEIGADITTEELLDIYDAVVLTTGAPDDRKLGIPGEDLDGVIGSAAFVGWYNSHPDFAHLDIDLNVPGVAVIGNGNVAVDAARVLAKTAAEMADSDLADYAATEIHTAPIRDIYMFGRRGPLEAKFTPKELGELGNLSRCVALVKPEQLPPITADDKSLDGATRKNLELLKSFSRNSSGDRPIRLHIEFYARPTAVRGDGRVESLVLERTRVEDGRCRGTGDHFEIDCGLVIPCIGYRSKSLPGIPYDGDRGQYINDHGLIAERLYAAGWARRGPTGTIGTNKPDGSEIAGKVLAETRPGNRSGHVGLEKLLHQRNVDYVTFRDWKKIEEAEISAAKGTAPRVKLYEIERMLDVVKKSGADLSRD